LAPAGDVSDASAAFIRLKTGTSPVQPSATHSHSLPFPDHPAESVA